MDRLTQHRINRTRATARYLLGMGISVMPIPRGSKQPAMKWKALFSETTTRLPYRIESGAMARDVLRSAFPPDLPVNYAVICGRASGGLFIIDCDSESVFDSVGAALRARGIPIFATAGKRGGHYWFRADVPIVGRLDAGIGIDVKADGGYVVGPESLHPDGILYRWHRRDCSEPPHIAIEQLAWLRGSDGQPLIVPVMPKSESEKAMDAITHYLRHPIGKGGRWQALRKAANKAAFAGLLTPELKQALKDKGKRDGLEDKDLQVIDDAESFAASKGCTSNPSNRHKQNPHYIAAKAFLQSHVWKGKGGRAERAVYAALLIRYRTELRAQAEHAILKGVFRASYRELLRITGIGYSTIHRALYRLIASKVVQRVGNVNDGDSRDGFARMYRFNVDAEKLPDDVQSEKLPDESQKVTNRKNKQLEDKATPYSSVQSPFQASITQNRKHESSNQASNRKHEESELLLWASDLIPTDKAILDAIASMNEANQPATQAAIAKATGLTKGAVLKRLQEDKPLRARGMVSVQPHGKRKQYSVAGDAQQRAVAIIDEQDAKRTAVAERADESASRRLAMLVKLHMMRHPAKWMPAQPEPEAIPAAMPAQEAHQARAWARARGKAGGREVRRWNNRHQSRKEGTA